MKLALESRDTPAPTPVVDKPTSTKHMPKENIWFKGRKTKRYYYLEEGTGDNLLQDDIDDGYKDYINIFIYDSLNDILEQEIHGGDSDFYLLKTLYKETSIEELKELMEKEYGEPMRCAR